MTHVLVVDDARLDRVLVDALLTDGAGYDVELVESAESALHAVGRHPPDVVVTDLVMPGMDGIELVSELRRRRPGLPVILMTSRGSEDVAVRALAAGAASYVPKRALEADLARTIADVVALSRDRHADRQLSRSMVRGEYEFDLLSDLDLIPPLVRYLQSAVAVMGVCDDTESNQIAMALHEALQNAVEHGNLELDSELRNDDMPAYCRLIRERAAEPPYSDRRVRVRATIDPEELRVVIRDEGPGFDVAALPDALSVADLDRVSGRGILLMRTFMDEVIHNDLGNEVSLIKRRAPSA